MCKISTNEINGRLPNSHRSEGVESFRFCPSRRPPYSTFLRFPFGAGAIFGVYVTVLVTTSRICLTEVRPTCLLALEFSIAARARSAASQSKCEVLPPTDRAENGERAVVGVAAVVCALNGESSG